MALVNVKQNQGDSLRDFVARFNEEALSIEEFDQWIAMVALQNGLRAGPFTQSLAKTPPRSLQFPHTAFSPSSALILTQQRDTFGHRILAVLAVFQFQLPEKTRGNSVERRSINASRISSDRSTGGLFLITMGHKGSEKGSDSEDSRGWMQAKNRRKNRSSSKISPGDELPKKNNRNSIEGGKVKHDYRRNRNNDRISPSGGGLEEDGRGSKNYNETIPEEDGETLPEPVGQMLSKKEQSNIPPPSKIITSSDVEGVGKAEKATVEKLPKNPNHTNSNESLVRTAEMTVVLRCNCEGCIKEICKIIEKAEACHDMSIDKQKNKVTVKGTMDMLKALANSLSNSKKLKNRTVLIAPLDDDGGLQADAESPSPETDMVGAASKTGKGTEPQKYLDGNKSNKDMVAHGGDGATKAAGKELDGNKSNRPPVTTVEMKMAVPCSGCGGHLRQIRKSVQKKKGFHSGKVSSDEMGKAVVSGTGTMDVINALKEELGKKFNTSVEVSPSPPVLGDLDHGGSENKRGRKQRKSAADGGGGQAKENLMHYDPTEYPNPSIYSYDGDYSFQLLRGLCPF
ncbi:uncharacterized protein LOC127813960 [Diospyros lotus]|uniref:uncharacterized protein LOC127813960 n=1 Tax=Diospyros lotus TaxID=55363 RepID=UPI00224CF1CE|nr:uncharacterized protein LOC127813960 [Diospyros lotus]